MLLVLQKDLDGLFRLARLAELECGLLDPQGQQRHAGDVFDPIQGGEGANVLDHRGLQHHHVHLGQVQAGLDVGRDALFKGPGNKEEPLMLICFLSRK